MADRVREISKRSGSKLHISKGSVNHIGATPYRFRLDVFVSYVDNIKNATDVCVTWERRGKAEATNIAKVKDKKAVFRQNLSMESTLFRRNKPSPKASSADPEELRFDEKKAKFILRKGGPDGKAVGKIALNLADYVRGTNSTVFADMKLSNGSVIVTKIEATMIQMGKKKKNAGSQVGSEACSEMTDVNSAENDSIFGDDDKDLGDLEIMTTPAPNDELLMSRRSETHKAESSYMSPISSATSSSTQSLPRKVSDAVEREDVKAASGRRDGISTTPRNASMGLHSPTNKAAPKGVLAALKKNEELKESPSLRNRIKNKMKGHKDKDKEKDNGEEDEDRKDSASKRQSKSGTSREQLAEIAELKACVNALRKENEKLKKSKQAAMEEIEALRADLETCEQALEEAADGNRTSSSAGLEMSNTLKEKDKKIAELEAQNENLLEELEEVHDGAVDSAVGAASGQINALKKKIEDLEVALRREPQYMDVVNELKVTKVSLALANMEKEQALFALQSATQYHSESE